MTKPEESRRKGRLSKKKILEYIVSKQGDLPDSDLNQLPPIGLINSLFPLLYHGEKTIKGRAIRMLGSAVVRLAENSMEDARNIVRRLMWNLNDESGSIGWGSPEAMGEILAQHEGLAREYAHILASYTRPEGNFLENHVLQSGLLWAIARLWKIHPGLILGTDPLIPPYLASEDATVRGRAAELLGAFRDKAACCELTRLLEDDSEYETLMEEDASKRRVKDAARDALIKIGC